MCTYLIRTRNKFLILFLVFIASVCVHIPSPNKLTEDRVEGLMCGATKSFSSLPEESQALKQGVEIGIN